MAMIKKMFLASLLAVLCTTGAFCASLAVQVVQHDSTHDEVRAISLLIEECFMDYFFERGYVVTNLPAVICSSSTDDKSVLRTGLSSADEGRCAYFVQLEVNYKTNTNSPEAKLLSNIKDIHWKLYSADSQQVIKSGKRTVGNIMRNEDSENGIRSFAEDIADTVYEYLMDN